MKGYEIMKRFFGVTLSVLLVFFAAAAAADPLVLTQDYNDTVTVYYNGTDASDGSYSYSYAFPHASVPEVTTEEADLSAASVNRYYEKRIQEYTVDYIPNQADYFASQYQNVSVDVNYQIMCNNDDFFSVLLHKAENIDGEIEETWEGNTFSRSSEMVGQLTSLPKLLGILDAGESDEWVEDRQTNRIWEVVCTLVWNAIQSNPDNLDFDPFLTKEDLEYIITPEYSLDQDFYIDENGDVIFIILSRFILSGQTSEETGFVPFRMTLEEIDDEM